MSFRKYNEGRPTFMGSRQLTSPDPVEIVRQYEEDENLAKILQEYQAFDNMEEESARVARQLQAEFDREILTPPYSTESSSQNDTAETVMSEDHIHDIGFNHDSELGDETIDFEQSEIEDEVEDDIEDEEEDDIEDENDDEENDDDENEEDEENDDEENDDDDNEEQEDGEVQDRSRLFPEEIERLPTHINATPLTSRNEAKICQICHESYAKGDKLRMLPCFHDFHTLCVDPWLLKSTTCPVCRIKVDLSGRVSSFF